MERLRRDRFIAVERTPEGINDAAEQPRPDGDPGDLAGGRHERADADRLRLVEDRCVDRLGLERERIAHAPVLEAQELAEARFG